MPTRSARTAWNGGTTLPEELIAGAHSACYAMSLSSLVAKAGGTPQSLDVTADVSLGEDPAGGFRLTGIKLTVRARSGWPTRRSRRRPSRPRGAAR